MSDLPQRPKTITNQQSRSIQQIIRPKALLYWDTHHNIKIPESFEVAREESRLAIGRHGPGLQQFYEKNCIRLHWRETHAKDTKNNRITQDAHLAE